MSRLKTIARELTPPLLWRWLRGARAQRIFHEFEIVPEGWRAARDSTRIKGWNVNGVLAAYEAGWPGFVRGLAGSQPMEYAPNALPGSPPDPAYHNLIHCYGYVLARAAWRKAAITLLDWGGGLGHYRLISQAFMPALEIDYYCKDVPLLADAGQKLFPDAHFYSDERCLEQRYDLVLSSHSLYYAEDWRATLTKLAAAASGYLYVTGLPTCERAESFVFVQRPYVYGYNTEYLGWCINQGELIAAAQAAGLRLAREFSLGYRLDIFGAPEAAVDRGYLFTPASQGAAA